MKKEEENKVILKQWVEVLIIVIALIAAVFSIVTIINSVKHEEVKGKDLYTYSYNSNLGYKVYLRPNKFYTMPYLGMNKQYITSLIDHIDLDVSYNFRSTEEIDYTYTYDIVATVKGIYSENEGAANEIWSKDFQITPAETKSGTGKTFAINKTVSVNYDTYNNVMSEFKNKFGLSVDSRADIVVKITVTGGLKGEENSLQESNTMTLQIPLLKQTIQLKPDYVNSGGKTITSTPKDTGKGVKVPLLIFGIVLLLGSIFVIKIYVSKLLQTTKKSEYLIRFNKILKEFADIIAETDNLPDLTKYDVVTIKQFNDLVDIEEELHSPIICAEIREDLESWFIILHDRTAYRYILKYEDFGKIIKD